MLRGFHMSGYDPFTGVFELTPLHVQHWLRRDLTGVPGKTMVERAAYVLAEKGFDVLYVHRAQALVRARRGAIWTALSGEPHMTEDRDDYTEPRHYTQNYLGHLVRPPMSGKAFGKLLEQAGLSWRDGKEWALTTRGTRYGISVVEAGLGMFRDEDERSLHWSLEVLDVLGLEWPKPRVSRLLQGQDGD